MIHPAHAVTPSFADFDARAGRGDALNVVFFGASLTWGANASDPNLTSYRALTGQRLKKRYPKARFTFWDAAIGGTGSQLGVFRLRRDVLRRHPDLVFLDFSANDGIEVAAPETLASYESLVRRIILEAKCPVVQVIFPFKWNTQSGDTTKMKRRDAHLHIARAYNCAVGDAIALSIERIKSGDTTLEKLWPIDGVHPGDTGYELFADAVWSGFGEAVAEKRACRPPAAMLYDDAYMTERRTRFSQIGPLPEGWKVGIPNRVAAYFDFLMSRWLDDEVIAAPGAARLTARFRGSRVFLLGEATPKSGKYRVFIDGKLVEIAREDAAPQSEFDPGAFARNIGGNGHHFQTLATDLDPAVEHLIEIEPMLEGEANELRLESLCVAGDGAAVRMAR